MKRFYILLHCISVILLIGGCRQISVREDENADTPQQLTNIKFTKTHKKIVKTNNSFAFALFQEINKQKSGENVFFSPFGVESMLSMILNGADGDTFSQIKLALGYESYDMEDINELYAAIKSVLTKSDNTIRFSNDNALYSNLASPNKDYCTNLKLYYDTEFHILDFSSPDALTTINNWCSEKTERRIRSIIDYLNPNDRIVFLNALLFDASWRIRFDPSKTKDAPFYMGNKQIANKPYMHITANYPSAEIGGDKVCILPFGYGGYDLIIILPSEDKNYKEYLSAFDESQYQTLLDAKTIHTVTLSLPKMSIDCELSDVLVNSLKNFGINDAFNINTANFSKMLNEKTSLGVVKQKTCFKIDEDGAQVSSVTMVGDAGADDLNTTEPAKMEFNANHPFLFIIKEWKSDAILMMGSFVL